LNCGDPLDAPKNWKLSDVQASLLYCTKEECQQSKPVTIKSNAGGAKVKKERPKDKGLARTLKQPQKYIKFAPDPVRVAEFAEYLKDSDMWNEQGFPIYSMIFKEYHIWDPEKGFEVAEMALAQYPDEVDANGCPSIQAVNSVRNYLKSITTRYNGNLEIYSTRTVKQTDPYKGRRVWRWHTLKNREDLDKQVNDMLQIAKNIELGAKKRENNFTSKTYDERMEKVGILDEFFK
jgi:hypothetical protein